MGSIKDLGLAFPRAAIMGRTDDRDAIISGSLPCPAFFLLPLELLRRKQRGIPFRPEEDGWMFQYFYPYLLRPDQPIRHHITIDSQWNYYLSGHQQQTACTFATMYLDTILYFIGVNATFLAFPKGQMENESPETYRKQPLVTEDGLLPGDYDIHRNPIFGFYLSNDMTKNFLTTAPVRSVGEQVALLSPRLKRREFNEGSIINLFEINVWLIVLAIVVIVPVIDWLMRGAHSFVRQLARKGKMATKTRCWPPDHLIRLWLGYIAVLLANSGQLASDSRSCIFIIWTMVAFLMQNFWSTDLLGSLLIPTDTSVQSLEELWQREDLPWELCSAKLLITDPAYFWLSMDRAADYEPIAYFLNFSQNLIENKDNLVVRYNNEITVRGIREMIAKTYYFVILDSNEYLQVVKDFLFETYPWHLSEKRYFWDMEFLRVNAKHSGSDFEKDLTKWYYLLEQHGFQIFIKRLRMIQMKIRMIHDSEVLREYREKSGAKGVVTLEYFQERLQSDEEEEIGLRVDTVLAFCYLLGALLSVSVLPLLWEIFGTCARV